MQQAPVVLHHGEVQRGPGHEPAIALIEQIAVSLEYGKPHDYTFLPTWNRERTRPKATSSTSTWRSTEKNASPSRARRILSKSYTTEDSQLSIKIISTSI